MGDDRRQGGLEIDRNINRERRVWQFRRIAWVVMGLVVLLAILGIFGDSGPLTNAVISSPDGRMELVYARFARFESQISIDISIRPLDGSDTTEVWLSQAYLQAIQFTGSDPGASSQAVQPDRIILAFDTPASGAPVTISLQMQPNKVGFFPGQIGIVGGPSLSFWQVVYP